MVEYILGNYLIEAGKITKEQLAQVMAKQDAVRVKLGLIAVSEGMMTSQQADEINILQTVKDKRFGDIAVEEGYLTEQQVNKLLKRQGNAYLIFMQTLIDEGLLELDELDWLLDDFKHVNGYSNTDLEDIKSDDIDRILPLMLPDRALPYEALIGTVLRILIRLVDRHVYVGRAAMVEGIPPESIALQRMEGESRMLDCFAERDGALLKMCRIFGQEDFARLDMDALDAAGELLNCANGLYVAEMSRNDRYFELLPPEYTAVDAKDVCRIPIFIGNQGLYFSVGISA